MLGLDVLVDVVGALEIQRRLNGLVRNDGKLIVELRQDGIANNRQQLRDVFVETSGYQKVADNSAVMLSRRLDWDTTHVA